MALIPMVSSASRRRRSCASRLRLRQYRRRQSRDQSQQVRFWMLRAWFAVLLPTKRRTLGQTVLLGRTRAAQGAQEDFQGHVDLSWTTRTTKLA